jgi:hypothetical protein
VRLVIARCSVDYIGRLTAHLPMATRLLLVKADGSVSVHADDRAYKPLNWMSPPCRLEEADGVWRVVNKTGEELRITLEEVLHDSSHELGVDPGLVKDGVEAHLQQLLAAQISTLGEGWSLVRREYPTAIGPVDILCRDADGRAVAVEVVDPASADGPASAGGLASVDGVAQSGGLASGGPVPSGGLASGGAGARAGGRYWAVEIKRKATIDAVEQLTRYLELLNRDPLLTPVGGILAAQNIVPQARTLAEDRGIRCVVLDYDELRGAPTDEMRLF